MKQKVKNNQLRSNFTLKVIIWLSLTCLNKNLAQNSIPSTLTIDKVFDQVKKFHPMSGRAMMQNDFASASLLKAKGSFDPSLQNTISQKNFDSKEYYSLINGELKIPTWTGIEFKGGYDLNRGVFLGPENSTPDNGLWYGGISAPLGQGLWIDDRRAEVKSARIGQRMAVVQQKDMTNDLLFQTANAYWEWFRAYHVRQILSEAEQNALLRFEAVRSFVVNGDRPGIDTVEANIQIQNIRFGLSQAKMEYIKATASLSGYLWNENQENSGLNGPSQPQDIEQTAQDTKVDETKINNSLIPLDHPYLEVLRQKLLQLEIEKKLKRDKLKPKLNLQYNPLSEAFGNNAITNFSINNYKWGLEFKMPLFLRKERGDVKLADLKIKETDLFLLEKTTDLGIKFENYTTEWQATLDQIEIFTTTVDLYKNMLDAERRLFNIGESSLFLINSREQSYINAKIKLAEILTKNKMAYYSILYFAGKLPDIN